VIARPLRVQFRDRPWGTVPVGVPSSSRLYCGRGALALPCWAARGRRRPCDLIHHDAKKWRRPCRPVYLALPFWSTMPAATDGWNPRSRILARFRSSATASTNHRLVAVRAEPCGEILYGPKVGLGRHGARPRSSASRPQARRASSAVRCANQIGRILRCWSASDIAEPVRPFPAALSTVESIYWIRRSRSDSGLHLDPPVDPARNHCLALDRMADMSLRQEAARHRNRPANPDGSHALAPNHPWSTLPSASRDTALRQISMTIPNLSSELVKWLHGPLEFVFDDCCAFETSSY
jgi:hypothetical protein